MLRCARCSVGYGTDFVRRSLVVVIIALGVSAAHADPMPPRAETPETMARAGDLQRPNEIYLEAFGKGGVWGLGFERALSARFRIGGVVSYTVLDGAQRLFTFAPYVSMRLLGRGHHRWFADVGPELAYLQTPSPVMEWSGTSSTGLGGEVSSGYEYRDHFLFRIYGEIVGGMQANHHLEPWLGTSVGWTF
jgi:hypothetical protein